jgi:hypothetical protein
VAQGTDGFPDAEVIERSIGPTPVPEKLTAEKLTLERGYTAKDFTALRAYVERIAPAVIARTYYDPDADPHAASPGAMERHLARMLDTLVQLAIAHGSTVLADHLRASIKQHGRPKLTAVTFRMVTEAAQLAAAAPHPDHAIGAWLRPRVARRLKGEGITTLGGLVAFCNRRGSSWWRSIPRIGPGRARVIDVSAVFACPINTSGQVPHKISNATRAPCSCFASHRSSNCPDAQADRDRGNGWLHCGHASHHARSHGALPCALSERPTGPHPRRGQRSARRSSRR